MIFGCVTGNRNLIQIGESTTSGSISSISDVSTDIQQTIDESQECTNGREFGGCFGSGSNDVGIGTSGFGGSSYVATADLQINQKINVQKNCDTLEGFDLFCGSDPNNLFSLGSASFGGTSNIKNVKIVSDQEINEVANCHLLLGFCQIQAENGIDLASVSNLDMVVKQKTNQVLECNDKNNTFCDAGAENVLSIGGLGFPGVISSVSNLDLSLNQKWNQETTCAEATEFGFCSNLGVNDVTIGDPALFGEGTVTADNLKADLSQTIGENAECGDTTIFFCSNFAANRIILGDTTGGFFDLFDNSSISNIDIKIVQSNVLENKCTGGESVGCSNGINENQVNIAGDVSATTARSSIVSGLDASIAQSILASNECKTDTGCSNDGDNIVDVGRASDVFRCCPVEADSAMNVQDLNADIEQTLFQNNDCSDNSPSSTEHGGACFNSMRNLVSIGSTATSFGFIDPFVATINVSGIDVNLAQSAEQNNNCNENANCFENEARNTVEIGTFSAVDVLGDETDALVTVSEISADAVQEIEQESNCSNAPVFQSCQNIGGNRILIGSPDAFGSNVDISKISLFAEETLLQENGCKNNILCSNNAENLISIGSGGSLPGLEKLSNVQHDSNQEIVQANKCENGDGETACRTDAHNLINIQGNSETGSVTEGTIAPINIESTQTIDQRNSCKTGSDCNEEAVNSANITQTGASSISSNLDGWEAESTNRVTLHQLSEQQDKCSIDSSCSDTSSNSATFVLGENDGDNNIDQQIEQNNQCLTGSTCGNYGSTIASIEGSNKEIKQEIDQQNLCVKNSTCSNTGSVTDGSGSNSQSNTCIDGSNCNNSGENNKTICIGSANCENFGTDTKVISKGQECSSGVAQGTTTVCANGHTFTH